MSFGGEKSDITKIIKLIGNMMFRGEKAMKTNKGVS